MSRTLTDPVDDALQAAHKQEVTFVEMAFDSGTVRASTAPHSIEWNSYTWQGLARIGSISPVEEAGQLEARSITLGLSGIPASMVSTAMGEHYQGRPVNLWLGVYTTEPALRFAFNTDTATPTHGSGTLSVVRGSAGGRYNSAGVYESISSNLPRFTYDPATLTARGLLVEESRVNLLKYSADFSNVIWTPVTVAVVKTSGIASPDGGTNAYTLDDQSASGDAAGIEQTVTISASSTQNYAASLFFKTGVSSSAYWDWYNFFTGASTKGSRLRYTYGTGTIALSSQDGGGAVPSASGDKTLPSGWHALYYVVKDSASGLNTSYQYRLYPGSRDAGVTGYHQFFGAQLEAADFPSSYIPSTSTAATRSADTITCTTTGVATAAGTVRITARTAIGAGTQTLWSLDDGTADERIYVQRNSSNEIHALVVDGGVTQADLTLGTVAHDTDFTVVLAWAANSIAGCLSGGSLVVDGAGTMPTVTTHRYGHDYATANHWNSTIAAWEAWPARLDDAQLVDLAAGEDNAQPVLGEPVGPVTYLIDNMTLAMGATATVELTAHTRLADWDRARLKHFNDADQQADYPGDRFCEHAEEMVEKQILW